MALFVGTGKCNAKCLHCAGKYHRDSAPTEDGFIDESLVYDTVRKCHADGARYLTLSGSGEPTLSPLAVTRTLQLVDRCRAEGMRFNTVSLYTNGIRIGEEEQFGRYLRMWRMLGLGTMYVTVHSPDRHLNAKTYGVASYPPLSLVFSRIHDAGLLVRANVVLHRERMGTLLDFTRMVQYLEDTGADMVAAWPVRDEQDQINPFMAPPPEEIKRMKAWVDSGKSRIYVRMPTSRKGYEKGQKLTLFPDGTLSSSWCN